jgi:hypothetical protein
LSVTWIVLGIFLVVSALLLMVNMIIGVPDEMPANQADQTTAQVVSTTRIRTTNTFDADFGWEVGACVDFEDDVARLVSCSVPHDAEIVDIASSDRFCPMRSEWYVDLSSGVACLVET